MNLYTKLNKFQFSTAMNRDKIETMLLSYILTTLNRNYIAGLYTDYTKPSYHYYKVCYYLCKRGKVIHYKAASGQIPEEKHCLRFVSFWFCCVSVERTSLHNLTASADLPVGQA